MKEENIKDVEENKIKQNNPTNKKMTLINFVFIIIIFSGLLIYMIKVDGIDNIILTLKSVDYKWVILGMICLIIHWVCEAVNLHIPIKKMYKGHKFKESVRVSMIGLLFNNITPFASGGQPMQAYELTKTGKRVSDSLSALVIKFIISQIALVTSTIVIILFQFKFFETLIQDYMWIAIVGVIVNIIAIVIAILTGTKKKIVERITIPIVRFLGKIHILKHPEKTEEKVKASIDNFAKQFKIIKTEKKMVLKMFVVAVIQGLAYYSITYMVYRAFGNTGITFWQIIPTQAILLLIMMFIPTPGSGLGAEGGFYLLFNKIFKEGTINMSILFWRIYTFYLPIIVGVLFLIPKKNKSKE